MNIDNDGLTTGRILIFIDATAGAGGNNVTLNPEGATTINGAATYALNTNRDIVLCVCSGTQWFAASIAA